MTPPATSSFLIGCATHYSLGIPRLASVLEVIGKASLHLGLPYRAFSQARVSAANSPMARHWSQPHCNSFSLSQMQMVTHGKHLCIGTPA